MADRYCGNCGHELKPADRFCPNCGRPVRGSAQAAAPDTSASRPPPQQRTTTSYAVDVAIVVIFLPVWLLLVSLALALESGGGGSGYQLGRAMGDALISRFPIVFVAAVVLTFLTVRWSRYQRRKSRHEAEVREAQEQFYLNERAKRERGNERDG